MTTNDITLFPIPALSDNYIWAIVDNSQKKALIVDPGEAKPVNHFLEQQKLTLAAILITHHHWDHTHGIAELKNQYSVSVFGPAKDNVAHLTALLDEHDTVVIPTFPFHFTVLEIPGHTHGHIAYYSPGSLFCGDTLFAAGCGRLFEGTATQLYTSLQKLAALPLDTRIYCGHEYTFNNLRFAALVEPQNEVIKKRMEEVRLLREKNLPSLPSTLEEEKATNPFLRCDVPTLIANVEKQVGLKLNHPIDVFTYLRQWKDEFK